MLLRRVKVLVHPGCEQRKFVRAAVVVTEVTEAAAGATLVRGLTGRHTGSTAMGEAIMGVAEGASVMNPQSGTL